MREENIDHCSPDVRSGLPFHHRMSHDVKLMKPSVVKIENLVLKISDMRSRFMAGGPEDPSPGRFVKFRVPCSPDPLHFLQQVFVDRVGRKDTETGFKYALDKAWAVACLWKFQSSDVIIREVSLDPRVMLQIPVEHFRVEQRLEMSDFCGNEHIVLIQVQMVLRREIVQTEILLPVEKEYLLEQDEKSAGNPQLPWGSDDEEIDVAPRVGSVF